MDMPDLVRGEQLTEDGRKVIALVEATLDQAEQLVKGQDVTSLNSLPGHFQDYWVNVRQANLHTPASWLKNRTYAAFHLYQQVLEQEQAAEKEEKTDTMADRLGKLEAQIAALTAALTKADAPAKTPTAEAVAPTPVPVTPKGKKAKTQEPEPATPAADTPAEEPDEAEQKEAE